MRLVRSIRIGLAVLACSFALASGIALAQSAPKPIPTVPGASSASKGGYTSSAPSTDKSSTIGPLEPYLVTLLIPVFGVFAAGVALYADRKMRVQGHGGR